MKKIVLSILVFIPGFLLSQNPITEICASQNTNGTVVNFERFKDTIYATGFFTTVCGAGTSYMAKWDNGGWQPVDIPLSGPGHSLRAYSDLLYISKYVESIDSNWVYVYDGNDIQKLGMGVYLTTASGFSELANIYDVATFNNVIIACGEFDRVGDQSISGIMQWDGGKWLEVGGGLSGNIPNTAPVMYPHQMLVFNGALYVVGNFRSAGGTVVNGIAKWDGIEWSAMGAGFNSTVYGIGIFENEIYVGGDFTKSGTTDLKRIAKWDGSQWVSPGFGFVPLNTNDYSFVHTIKEIDQVLLIAGGLKQLVYDDGSTASCGGIVGYSSHGINDFSGGVPSRDIEAVIQTENQELLVGGGVFGNGYFGKTSLLTQARTDNPAENLEIYPNPFNETLVLNSKDIIKNYSVTDLNGRVVASGTVTNNVLDIHSVQAGIYILRLKSDQHFYVSKIIKK